MNRIQFSLRSFLLACAILGVVLAIVIRQFQSYQRFQDSIEGVFNFRRLSSQYNYELHGYLNHRDEPVAFTLWVIKDEIPEITHSYGYSIDEGGTLIVDGKKVQPAESPWLFVNGPYGHTVTLELNQAETRQLMSIGQPKNPGQQITRFWREVVEPRIYQIAGQKLAGKREGVWTFRLTSGAKYMEGHYRAGKRHGPWTIYYANGQIRAQLNFADGVASGMSTYFSDDGRQLAAEPAEAYRFVMGPDGGKLMVGDIEIPTPDLPPDIDTVFLNDDR